MSFRDYINLEVPSPIEICALIILSMFDGWNPCDGTYSITASSLPDYNYKIGDPLEEIDVSNIFTTTPTNLEWCWRWDSSGPTYPSSSCSTSCNSDWTFQYPDEDRDAILFDEDALKITVHATNYHSKFNSPFTINIKAITT